MNFKVYTKSMSRMKVASFVLVLCIFSVAFSEAQVPMSRIPYQASLRNASGRPLALRNVGFKVDIVDSGAASVFYSERHAVATDAQGILSVVIGSGTVLSGNITQVPWSVGRKYVRTSVDTAGGLNWLLLGISEMLSVPYALYAQTSGESPNAHLRGTRNLVLADSAGYALTSGADNVALGSRSLRTLQTGSDNVAIGGQAGSQLLGSGNVAIGKDALLSATALGETVAIGWESLKINRASGNTAIGARALAGNTTGINNVAVGTYALVANQTGQLNTAVGFNAMINAASVDHVTMIGANAGRDLKASYNVGVGSEVLMGSSGIFNIAVGNASLQRNTTGSRNIGIGQAALSKNTTAENNTAVGYGALVENTVGTSNSAFGIYSMDANVTGYDNSAFGRHSLQDNVSGIGNTSLGVESMYLSINGSENTSVGYRNMYNNSSGFANTSVGTGALATNTTGSGLTALGAGADVASNALVNATVIGRDARVGSSNTMAFGNGSVTKWAFGLPTTAHALQVGSNATNGNGAYLTVGGSWTNASSRQFKEDVEIVSGEEILRKLRELEVPRWRYRGTTETHIGPIAEPFHALFGLGDGRDSSHISTVDASGVALRAVQALMDRLERSERQRETLEARLSELEQMVEKLLRERTER
jgi:hypothetical protein